MPIRIVVRVPRGSTTEVSEHTFTRKTIIVGRSPECDLVLPGDEVRVSRQHVRLERREGGYLLVDLGSRNGTLLNDAIIPPGSTHPLNETDVVKMGTVEMEVVRVLLDERGEDKDAAIRKNATSARYAATGASDPREKAALETLQAVSKHFVGDGDFSTPEQIKLFGEMLRLSLDVLLEGLFNALSQRKQFEGEFDASVTMAFQREANPMKEKHELAQFKKFPVDWKLQPPLHEVKDNLERATRDIAQHQMGLLAGMQQVLEAIVKRLDPIAIEQQAKSKAGLLAKLSPGKLAWHEYLETYSRFLAESSKLFNDLIYPNLQKGYLLSHKEKTRILQSAAELAKRAEVVAEAAAQSAADLRRDSGE
ncbi:MAG: FHA domain-containing protein [Planctomycetes bacterium]|nr:FHA domain-containing protein [Planctomycetota bacterium]MCW8136042.1 FHA domain-containing protein [Planctomycetota bacterium]